MRGLVVLALLAGCGPSAAPRAAVDGTRHDFGTLPQNSTRLWTVTIRNEGSGDLEIRNITAECGCTAALLSATRVPPGGKADLQVTFLSGHLRGFIKKEIVIETTGGKITLDVTATVTPNFKITPEELNFGSVKLGAHVTRTVEIEDVQGKPFAISVRFDDPDMKIESRAKSPSCHEITLTFAPKDRARLVAAPLEIKSDRPEDEIQTVMIQAKAEATVTVTPPDLYLGYTKGGKFPDQKLRVEGEGAVRIERIVVEPMIFEATLHGTEITLAALPAGEAGFVSGSVKIYVSGMKEPLTVLFTGTVRSD